ncbi:MAG: hypothetical protein A3J75_06170 [Acidobacteria bacterium RBG_16_68_9]|nr:MAG: hypothetical protein A3J75_06170 [Acidobacteria bacterium RBG_16_68_9]
MPVYEYECPKCGEFEITQRITEDALKKCPTCRAKVKKLMSSTSFQLKGAGWYVTDYARKDEKKPKEEKPATETKADTGTKTDTSTKTESTGKKKDESARAA